MLGEFPNFIHVPMEIFLFYEMGKKPKNQNKIVYLRGGSCTHFHVERT
jgi:hypothetical protein